MSSLRLALKLSMAETPSVSNKKKKKRVREEAKKEDTWDSKYCD